MAETDKIAVISDCVSSEFYFKKWYKYYSDQVDSKNIYIITYDDGLKNFNNFDLGGVWRCPHYNNSTRVQTISQLTQLLLQTYQFVVRVDTDEFLAPDPRVHKSLASFLDALDRPYVTAQGYDVVQGKDEAALNLDAPLLGQRRFAYPYDALNKTCVVGLPVSWAPGFHFASVFPEFNHLYLFHMKRADIDIQIAIGEAIARQAANEPNQKYYLTPREDVEAYNRSVLNFSRVEGWSEFERTEYMKKFLEGIRYKKDFGGVSHGKAFRMESVLVTIPGEFSAIV